VNYWGSRKSPPAHGPKDFRMEKRKKRMAKQVKNTSGTKTEIRDWKAFGEPFLGGREKG